MKILKIIFLVIIIAGCAQIPSFKNPDKLNEYNSQTVYLIDADVIYEIRKGTVDWFFGIRKGTYVPKYQDDEAYYFTGEGFSSCIGTKSKTGGCTSNYKGGLWISKSDPSDIRMYYIDGAGEKEVNAHMGWVYYLTLGSIVVETPNKIFSKKITTYVNNKSY